MAAGRRKDEGSLRAEQVSLGETNNVREAVAITRECPIMRHANNLESVLTCEETFAVHQPVIAGPSLTRHIPTCRHTTMS